MGGRGKTLGMFAYHGQKEIQVDHTHLLRTQGRGHQLLDGFRCLFSRQVSLYYRNTCKGLWEPEVPVARSLGSYISLFFFFFFSIFGVATLRQSLSSLFRHSRGGESMAPPSRGVWDPTVQARLYFGAFTLSVLHLLPSHHLRTCPNLTDTSGFRSKFFPSCLAPTQSSWSLLHTASNTTILIRPDLSSAKWLS